RSASLALGMRARTNVSRCRYALQPYVSDEDLLRRALPANHSVGSLVASFRAAEHARFFFDPGEARAIAGDLARHVPGWTQRTSAAGDQLRAGFFRLLGADEIRLTGGV